MLAAKRPYLVCSLKSLVLYVRRLRERLAKEKKNSKFVLGRNSLLFDKEKYNGGKNKGGM